MSKRLFGAISLCAFLAAAPAFGDGPDPSPSVSNVPTSSTIPATAAGSLDPDGLRPETSAILDACFDDYNRLRFDRAEAEARHAMALQPESPLAPLYLQAELAAQIQEASLAGASLDGALERFDAAARASEPLIAAWEGGRHDGRAQLYLGTSLGTRALVDLYRHRLLAAYQEGRSANAALLLAQKRDPALRAADLGLGQFLYYSGRLQGILRLFLSLQGDIAGGIRRIEACGSDSNRCSCLARLVLARILTEEEPDFQRALPYVQEAQSRYPENWAYERLALEEAKGLGLDKPAAQSLVLALAARWDAGWRPPAYVRLDPEPLRRDMVRVCGRAHDPAGEHRQLAALP
jgi:hypothetical protein